MNITSIPPSSSFNNNNNFVNHQYPPSSSSQLHYNNQIITNNNNTLQNNLILDRNQKLIETWNLVHKSLIKLEKFIQNTPTLQKSTNEIKIMKPWENEEYITLFTSVYDLCILPDSPFYEEELYKLYSNYIKNYLTFTILPKLKELQKEDFLNEIVNVWNNFKNIFVKFCGIIFKYLDKFHVTEYSKRSLKEEAYYLFKTIIFDTIKIQLRHLILEKIDLDRKYFTISTFQSQRNVLKLNLEIFIEMNNYVEEFEDYIKKETEEFYYKLAEEWIEQCTLSEYLIKVKKQIKEEYLRIIQIFPNNYSQNLLIKICDFELLKKRQLRLLDLNNSGVKNLIKDEKIDDLKRLFKLMNRLENGLDPIAEIFKKYISNYGNELFQKYELMIQSFNDENSYSKCVKKLIDTYIIELLDFYNKMKFLTNDAFQHSTIFHKALSDGFKIFINLNFNLKSFEIRTVQLFAYYCDEILRKKLDDIDLKLDQIIDFIHFFTDRDMFIEEYRKQLSKRLLETSYIELDERQMISKLKYHYAGVGDLYKLEKMLSDKSLANEMKNQYIQYLNNQQQSNFELNVTVLTMGMWPLKTKEYLILPKEFVDSQISFKDFYDSRNQRRVLKWVYSKSYVQLSAQFNQSNHLFEMTTQQAILLLLFNDNQSLSIEQLEAATGMKYSNQSSNTLPAIELQQSTTGSSSSQHVTDQQRFMLSKLENNNTLDFLDLKQTIFSLTSKKLPVLLFDKDNNTISLNENFTFRQHKIKFPNPRITRRETQSTQTAVCADRSCILEACIVRIMKTRKTLPFQTLVNEVINQVHARFSPDLKQIKKRIESLITRDYLKRDPTNNSILNYVA
ncbi:hypothetical protein ABK040_004104 [Willaertia magna]